ncbi:type IV pilin-like G/H family protein [Pseudanabaena minima]|uniref:type IV pilin-like G/H family protein n=1 Tax=Pseudanabaena minima TaxID=890415 RepID=UPI003DA92201
MIGQVATRQSETLQEPLQTGDLQEEVSSFLENISEIDTEANLLADLPQKEDISTKSKKYRRLLRWSIYGLLGFGIIAIVAPAFLGSFSCGTKARSAEARSYVGSMGKAQQAFWLENGALGRSIPALAIGIKEETDNYKYDLQSFELVAYHYGVPKNDNLKSFVGAVFVVPETNKTSQGLNHPTSSPKPSTKKELTTTTILCESPKLGVKTKLPKPFLENGIPKCAEGTVFIR